MKISARPLYYENVVKNSKVLVISVHQRCGLVCSQRSQLMWNRNRKKDSKIFGFTGTSTLLKPSASRQE